MRVLLDTNLWSYIAERNEQEAFEGLEVERGITIVIPPSLLIEALLTPMPEIRDRITAAMTSRRASRTHPLPEARLEADELVAEVRRLGKPWLLRFPRPTSVRPFETFWTRRVWQLAAANPAAVAAHLSGDQAATVEAINRNQRENKDRFAEAGFVLGESEPFVDISPAPEADRMGWEGGRIEAWRSDTAAVWWAALVTAPRRAAIAGGDTTYADWATAWLDLDHIAHDREAWNRFWYYEVDARYMPRNWIRNAVSWIQHQAKLGSGNARDSQHAAYLLDADVFLTADRRFARGLEHVYRWTTTNFAEPIVVPATGSIVRAIESALP